MDRHLIETYFASPLVPKLHIGCGSNTLKGWLNADFYPPPEKPILNLDARKPFPFSDSSFDYIFSEHMIEHIPYEDGCHMLQECHRVLRPGGRIRLSTPDLQFLLGLYNAEKSTLQKRYIAWSAETFIPHGEATDTMVINNFVRDWGHCFIYDEKTLNKSLAKAGFVDIKRCELQQSDLNVLSGLENEDRMPEGFVF